MDDEASEVQLRGALEFPFWVTPEGRVGTSKQLDLKLKAVFRIEAPVLKSDHHRAKIDLVVVLEVTSSIGFTDNKQPSKLDLLKKAMGFIISNLDDGDRIATLALENDRDKWTTRNNSDLIEISIQGRKLAMRRVNRLVTVGFAEAKSGLARAVQILDNRSVEERQTRQGFIILVSDRSEKSDEPNRKLSRHDPALHKYPVHTLGLGELHDPTELFHIADASNGTYSSVTDASKITEALAVCLALFKSVVAVDVSVQIAHRLDENHKLIKTMTTNILHCDWGCFKRDEQGSSSCNRVQGGILYAGEVKHLIVDIKCTFLPTWKGAKDFDLLKATATYKHAAQGKRPNSTTVQEVQCDLGVSLFAAGCAKSCDSHSTHPSPMFLHQMVRIDVLDKCIASFLNECKNKKAENASNHSLQLQGLGDDLASSWKAFKGKETNAWKAAREIGLDLQLQRMESDIDAMVSGLKQGLGVGCVYSWQSSHTTQRATTTALALTTNAFLTPAIEEMMKKAHLEQSADQGTKEAAVAPAGDNPPHGPASPPAESAALPPAGSDCKRAVQLMDRISEQLELWHELDRGVPPVFQPSSVHENTIFTDLTTVLRKNISQARQYDLYLTVRDAVKQWRQSSQQQGEGSSSDDTPAPAL